MELKGKTYEVGKCYGYNTGVEGSYDSLLIHFDNIPDTAKMLNDAKPPQKSYDEAIAYLTNPSEFTVLNRYENEDYSILNLFRKVTEKYILVAVKKTGGYLLIDDHTGYSDEYHTFTVELVGNNLITTKYPFSGPHGATHNTAEYDLDNFNFN
jgi:hypothetical protein